VKFLLEYRSCHVLYPESDGFLPQLSKLGGFEDCNPYVDSSLIGFHPSRCEWNLCSRFGGVKVSTCKIQYVNSIYTGSYQKRDPVCCTQDQKNKILKKGSVFPMFTARFLRFHMMFYSA
jgi:hypothetical protein